MEELYKAPKIGIVSRLWLGRESVRRIKEVQTRTATFNNHFSNTFPKGEVALFNDEAPIIRPTTQNAEAATLLDGLNDDSIEIEYFSGKRAKLNEDIPTNLPLNQVLIYGEISHKQPVEDKIEGDLHGYFLARVIGETEYGSSVAILLSPEKVTLINSMEHVESPIIIN